MCKGFTGSLQQLKNICIYCKTLLSVMSDVDLACCNGGYDRLLYSVTSNVNVHNGKNCNMPRILEDK